MENSAPTFRVYRLKWGQRAIAVLFLAFAIFFMIASRAWPISGRAETKPIELFIAAVLFIAGLGLTLNFFTATVTFTVDAIEQRSLFRQATLPFTKIRGPREFVVWSSDADGGSRTRYLKLESNDDRHPPLEFMKSYTFDNAFFRWFNKLPDRDAEGQKTREDSNFGLV
jgi:hypothetical protein